MWEWVNHNFVLSIYGLSSQTLLMIIFPNVQLYYFEAVCTEIVAGKINSVRAHGIIWIIQ